MHKLVLIRHGESTWNQENRFTGWTDVDLSDKGVIEATEAGRLLRAALSGLQRLPTPDAATQSGFHPHEAEGHGKTGHKEYDMKIIYTVVTRLEVSKLTLEIQKIDPEAFVVMNSVKDMKGGMIKKRPLK